MAFATKPKPRSSTTHKKRTGQHKKHDQRYLKHYWPYLPLLSIVGVGLIVSTLWHPGSGVLGTSSDLSAVSLLSSTNSQRLVYKEESLSLNTNLSNAAQAKANDMVSQNFWSHNTPDGKTPWSFITAAGYSYERAGENLAYGFNDASTTLTAWMHSPEHRANILNNHYEQVGFGIASSPNFVGHGPETIVVAMYATPQINAAPVAYTQSLPTNAVKGADDVAQNVSRIGLLPAGQSSLATFAVASIASVGALLFVTRHAYKLRRSLVKGEAFVLEHPTFDALILLVVMAGFILTRSAGMIM